MKKQIFLSFTVIVLIIFSGLFISFRAIAQETNPTSFRITYPECPSGCSASLQDCGSIKCASGKIPTPPIKPGSSGTGCCCCSSTPSPTPTCRCTEPDGGNGDQICDNSVTPGRVRTCSIIYLTLSNKCVGGWNNRTCPADLRICSVLQDGHVGCSPDCSNKLGALCEGSPGNGHELKEVTCSENEEFKLAQSGLGLGCCCPKKP